LREGPDARTTDPGLGPTERMSLAAAIICTSAVGTTAGLMWPLLSLILDARGVGSGIIGLSSAAQSLATIAVSPFAWRLTERLGMVRSAASCIIVILLALALLRLFTHVNAWFALRFLLGAATSTLFICTQTWVNQMAPDRVRGRIIGIFGFLWSAGFGAGPLVIRLTGIEGWPPFLAALALVAFAGVPLLFAGETTATVGRVHFGFRGLAALGPGLAAVVASLVQGVLDSVTDSFLPLYGLRSGFDPGASVTMLIVLQGGILAVQLPVGLLADRVDRFLLLGIATVLGLVTSLALPLAVRHDLTLWPDLFLLGVASGAIWNVSLVLIGQIFEGGGLSAALALRSLLYGIGSVIGPPLTGWTFAGWGSIAVPLALALACGLLGAAQLAGGRRARS